MTETTNALEDRSFRKRARRGLLASPTPGNFSSTDTAGGHHVVLFAPPRTLQLQIKRVIDVLGAIVGLILLSPIFIAAGVAIKLSGRGPIFFSQAREGLGGAPIRVLKFRTMRASRCDASGVEQTVVGDDRVTAVGRFLRKTNIDELPQLVNVLLGDMSLIGPRPHPFNMRAAGMRYDEYVPYYKRRHVMKPGITGWAQCHGLRGPTDDPQAAKARIDHDLDYIQNFSLILDFQIVWKTAVQELGGGTGV